MALHHLSRVQATARMLLFVVDGSTRGIASMVETAEYLARGERRIAVVRARLRCPLSLISLRQFTKFHGEHR